MTRSRRLLSLGIIALFTLALGVALGAGPLQGDVGRALDDADPAQQSTAERADDAARQRAARYEAAFADALSSDLLADALTGRGVLLLALPGADAGALKAVAGDVEAAGGAVTTTLRADRELVDPGARVLVDTLAKRLIKQEVPDVEVNAGTPVYERVGAVLSRALLTAKDGRTELDDSARSVFNSFQTADLLHGEEPGNRASLAIVVAGGQGGTSAAKTAQGTIVNSLLARMDGAGDGVVLAGPPAAAQPGGLVAALRADEQVAQAVSGVDTVDQRSGQIVAVLAAAEQARGETGQYGVTGTAEAVMPGADEPNQ